MFGVFGKDDPRLEQPIDRVLTSMEEYGPDAPEYDRLLTSLERLYKLQRGDVSKRVAPDTVLTVAGNLMGILIIVAYEQKHVLSSKSLGFIGKPK